MDGESLVSPTDEPDRLVVVSNETRLAC
jgi:hypothetical protein